MKQAARWKKAAIKYRKLYNGLVNDTTTIINDLTSEEDKAHWKVEIGKREYYH